MDGCESVCVYVRCVRCGEGLLLYVPYKYNNIADILQ